MKRIIEYIKKFFKLLKDIYIASKQLFVEEYDDLQHKLSELTPSGIAKGIGKETCRFLFVFLALGLLASCSNENVRKIKKFIYLPYESCINGKGVRLVKLLYSFGHQIIYKAITGKDWATMGLQLNF